MEELTDYGVYSDVYKQPIGKSARFFEFGGKEFFAGENPWVTKCSHTDTQSPRFDWHQRHRLVLLILRENTYWNSERSTL